MKIERSKNAGRNIVFGTILKIYQIVLPFVIRTVMIYYMGVQYLGLNSLFTSILQVLNLAELGVGSAMIYSMYKPIAEDDNVKICALMNLYRLSYRIIGLVIAVAGLALVPFLPKLIKSDLPADVNLYLIYVLNLATTVLSYWLFAYKNCLLNAHQRNDVASKVSIITHTIQYALQITVVCVFKDYYLFVIIALATQALTNIITAAVTGRMYPEYKPYGWLEKEEILDIVRRVRDLFTSKVGSIVVNSSDTVVISAFLGLTTLAIYQNYFYIVTAIIGVVNILFSACMAGVGNSIIVETKEKNFKDLEIFTMMVTWVAGFAGTCLLCLYQPFMKIWVGNSNMLKFSAVICFCIYYFIYEFNRLFNMYKDAAGMWHEDRYRPLVTALTNLALNLLTVQYWGIYGVLLSTVISMLIVGMPWLIHNLFTVVFERSNLIPYLKKIGFYLLMSFLVCLTTFAACSWISISERWTLIVRAMICVFVPNTIFYFSFRGFWEFKQLAAMLNRITKGRIRFLSRMK